MSLKATCSAGTPRASSRIATRTSSPRPTEAAVGIAPGNLTTPLSERSERHMAVVDYYLKIDGIEGEANAKGHEKEIEIDSFSYSSAQQGTFHSGGGGGAGKALLGDIAVTMKLCKASPKL